jgi:hypothetical protein
MEKNRKKQFIDRKGERTMREWLHLSGCNEKKNILKYRGAVCFPLFFICVVSFIFFLFSPLREETRAGSQLACTAGLIKDKVLDTKESRRLVKAVGD